MELGVGEGVGFGLIEAVAEFEGLGVDSTLGSLDEIGVGDVEEFGEYIGTATPLFQTNFFPDLTQVYLIFDTVLVEFIFVQLVPAIVAEFAGNKVAINSALIKVATRGNLVLSMS